MLSGKKLRRLLENRRGLIQVHGSRLKKQILLDCSCLLNVHLYGIIIIFLECQKYKKIWLALSMKYNVGVYLFAITESWIVSIDAVLLLTRFSVSQLACLQVNLKVHPSVIVSYVQRDNNGPYSLRRPRPDKGLFVISHNDIIILQTKSSLHACV